MPSPGQPAGYMDKNVNAYLLGMIILVVASIVGGTLYYGSRFSNVTGDYNALISRIESLPAELLRSQTEYNYTIQSLSQTSEEKENLKKVYTVTTSELKDTEEHLNETLRTARQELSGLKEVLADVQQELSSVKSQLNNVRDDLNECKDDYNSCQDDLAACQG